MNIVEGCVKRRSTTVLVAAAVWLAATPAPAAPGDRAIEQAAKVLKLNREAMELYESLDFELAKRTLLEALDLGEAANLGNHTVMVRTHANLAVVYALGLKDEARAVKQLREALELKPDFKPSRDYATPEMTRLLSRAQRELKEGTPAERPRRKVTDEEIKTLVDAPLPKADPAESGDRPKGKLPSAALDCPTSGEVQAGDEVTLRCVTAPDLRPSSVVMFYKRSGKDDFTSVPMKSTAGEGDARRWVGRIPAGEVAGKWLPIYFEARDGRGAALAMSGRNDSPSIINVRGDAEGNGEQAAVRTREEAAPTGEDGQPRGYALGPNRLWIGLGLGSGGGYAKGDGVEAYRQYVHSFQPGLAGEGLAHVVPEIGYFLTPTFALSLQGRSQYIPRDNRYTAAGANAVLARALFFGGGDRGRFYGALAAGGGEGFRLSVKASTMDGEVVHDTVRGGPILAGVGGGFSYAFNGTFSWMIESNLLAGFPTFSTALDVNTGLRASF